MSIQKALKKISISTLAGVSAIALFSPAALADKRVRVHYPNHASRVISIQSVKRIHNHKRTKVNVQIKKLFNQFHKAGYSRNQTLAILANIYREDAKFGPIMHHHKPIYFGIIPVNYSDIAHYAKQHHMSAKSPVAQFNYLLATRHLTKAFARRANSNPVNLNQFIGYKVLRVSLLPSKPFTHRIIKHIKSVVVPKHTSKNRFHKTSHNKVLNKHRAKGTYSKR